MKKIIFMSMLLTSTASFAEGFCEFGRASIFESKQSYITNSKEECIKLAADTILPIDNTSFKVVVKFNECPSEAPGRCKTTYKEKMRFSELLRRAETKSDLTIN